MIPLMHIIIHKTPLNFKMKLNEKINSLGVCFVYNANANLISLFNHKRHVIKFMHFE